MKDSNRPRAIHVDRVTKAFTTPTGSRYTAVQGVTLDVSEGVFLSVVGPSGCGKSTLLNLTAGLTTPTEGWVAWLAAVETGNDPDQAVEAAREGSRSWDRATRMNGAIWEFLWTRRSLKKR